ncbi:MAG: NAD-dependent epimerase/dehydratase family protein [Planctomycetota bacterium]
MASELDVPLSSPVLVTGATGYVAGWVVERLVRRGLTVHAAVRDPENESKIEHLAALAERLPGDVRFFQADLLEPDSYADAMTGCSTVFHTASPFVLTVEDAQRDLVDPAVRGTRNVLSTASATPGVTRVVVTSSCVAVFGDNTDVRYTKTGVFTEDDWNSTSSLTHNPYAYSKTLAEREAWRIASDQNSWSLVTVNPHFVFGPGVSPRSSSHSFHFLRQLGDGTFRSGVPAFGVAMVDVRDVAEMHVNAAFHPKAEGRYLTFAQSFSVDRIASVLRAHFGDRFLFPKRRIPKPAAWLFGPLADSSLTRKAISRNVGVEWKGDNTKSIRDFDFEYRSIETSIVEMFEQLIESGQVKAVSS